jgi:hypothetical protein
LGIDQTKIYNYDPEIYKTNKEKNFLSVLVGNNAITGTMTPERLISDVIVVNCLQGLEFEVYFIEKKILFIAQNS